MAARFTESAALKLDSSTTSSDKEFWFLLEKIFGEIPVHQNVKDSVEALVQESQDKPEDAKEMLMDAVEDLVYDILSVNNFLQASSTTPSMKKEAVQIIEAAGSDDIFHTMLKFEAVLGIPALILPIEPIAFRVAHATHLHKRLVAIAVIAWLLKNRDAKAIGSKGAFERDAVIEAMEIATDTAEVYALSEEATAAYVGAAAAAETKALLQDWIMTCPQRSKKFEKDKKSGTIGEFQSRSKPSSSTKSLSDTEQQGGKSFSTSKNEDPQQQNDPKKGHHIINNGVRKIIPKITEMFFKKINFSCNLDYLCEEGYIESRVYKKPLEEADDEFIQSQTAFPPKSQVHIDQNDESFGKIMSILRSAVILYWASLFHRNENFDEETIAVQFIEFSIINQDVYVDKQALGWWKDGGGDMDRYKQVHDNVAEMYRSLTGEEMKRWVESLRVAYQAERW